MKKNLLKILACSAVVAMVASCGNKTPSNSQSDESSSGEETIVYKKVTAGQINQIESDGSYTLDGQYVEFSGAAVSGRYGNVLFVNETDVEYYSDLTGVEIHQKEAGDFAYKDVVTVKGKVASEDGRVFVDEAEVTLEEAGAGSVYTWSSYVNRYYYENQFNKTFSAFPFYGVDFQLASLPEADKLAAGEATSFYVTFPGEQLDLDDLDNTCPMFVKVPGELADETFEFLEECFADADVGDVISLDAHFFYSLSEGGLGMILDDEWFDIDEGSTLVLDKWEDVIDIAAEGLETALPNIGIDDNPNLISYLADDSYFHGDINNFASWQIAAIPAKDAKDFGAFEATINVKAGNFNDAITSVVTKANALTDGWSLDTVNTDSDKNEYAYKLVDAASKVEAVLTIEQGSSSTINVDFFAKAFPWTALSILGEVNVTMGKNKNDINIEHVDFGREYWTYGGYYYAYDEIIDTLALVLLPEGTKEAVKPHDATTELGYNGWAATYTFEGFTIEVDSREIPGQAKPAAYIFFRIWESTNITNADAAVVKAGYEARVNDFFGTTDFASQIPAMPEGYVDQIIFDYYYESYYQSLFEKKGEFTDYEFTLVLKDTLPDGENATTFVAGLKTLLLDNGFEAKTFNTTRTDGYFNATSNEFVILSDAKATDTTVFFELYNLSDDAVASGIYVTASFATWDAAKAEYVDRAKSKASDLTGTSYDFASALPELAGASNYLVNWGNEGTFDDDYEEYGMTLIYTITATYGDSDNIETIVNGYYEALGTANYVVKEFLQTVGLYNATTGEFVVVQYNKTTKLVQLTLYVNDAKAAQDVIDVKAWSPAAVAEYLTPYFTSIVDADPVTTTTGDDGIVTVVYEDSVSYFGWYVNYVLTQGDGTWAYGTWTALGYNFDGDGTFANMTYFYYVYQTFEGNTILVRADKVDETTMTIKIIVMPAD